MDSESSEMKKLRRNSFRKTWDPFMLKTINYEEEVTRKLIKFLQYIICFLFGVCVLGCAFLSKSSLLLLISISNINSPFENKPFSHLILASVIVVPNILTFVKALWKVSFGSSSIPPKGILAMVCLIEAIIALATSVLVLVCLPHFDIVTNLCILNGVCLIPSCLQIVFKLKTLKWSLLLPLSGFGFTFLGLLFFILVHNPKQRPEEVKYLQAYVALTIVSLILVSINWWENFTLCCKIKWMENVREGLSCSRNITYLFTSAIRILVTFGVVVAWIPIKEYKWEDLKTVSQSEIKIVLGLFGIQACSSVLCHWFGVLACKMHAIKRSFVVPSILATPMVLTAILIVLVDSSNKYGEGPTFNLTTICDDVKTATIINTIEILFLEIPQSFCRTQAIFGSSSVGLALLGSSAICFWLGLFFTTFYVWGQHIQRIERTSHLFVRWLYEAAFMEQSLLLNMRNQKMKKINKEIKRKSDHVMIYLCATMWHETVDEMEKILSSIFRLDKYKPNSFKSHKDNFDFEAHIYFDDAFTILGPEENVKERVVNKYVKSLVSTIEAIYRTFWDNIGVMFLDTRSDWVACNCSSMTNICHPTEEQNIMNSNLRIFSHDKHIFNDEQEDEDKVNQTITETPYGGRISYTLPYGNIIHVHLKDKQKIRHKKRWSQIMYMYYLLGWKLNRKYAILSGKFADEVSTENTFKMEKENTYILALDGDTDFQPSAVILLVDRLRRYPHVGAACGRIHPTGIGPVVWYQKFEYAVGHWLQKTAEHVLGCVLCSPGCFSLFRAAALMDDNVVKKYTTKANEAQHFVQYDQGEDRWLCTLLLQQGWRVEYNAASDAYTNAPQEFKEFYNQRRRWGPSTLANTIDLLDSGSATSKKNPSISKLYILYQIIGTAASILGPATVVLMIAGSFTFVFGWNGNVALALGVIPPGIYIIICYHVKSDTQINIAAFLSIVYAFLMIATIMSIIGEMIKEQSFITPTGLFFISMAILFLSTALLHPQEFHLVLYGLLYIICIPSGYLLLPIYSMVNMNNVSWGTREDATAKKSIKKKPQQVKRYEKKCKCCCWDVELAIKEDKKEEIQQIDSANDDLIETNPRIEDNWISNLKNMSYHLELIEDTLDEIEKPFWNDLIEQYLQPIEENKERQKEIARNLKSLRNKVTFLFFMINILWIVSTFVLQLIGTDLRIKIPKILSNGSFSPNEILNVEPIGFMFLLTFAGLLAIQFSAMLYHRINTLIHFVAYKGTEVKPQQVVGKYQQMGLKALIVNILPNVIDDDLM